MKFKRIVSLEIDKFRTLENKSINLGKTLTILAGKNGTMKSCLLGLIAHPFISPNDAEDVYGNKLKTSMKDVFFLSPKKDKDIYRYGITAEAQNGKKFTEPIRVSQVTSEDKPRHRIIVGKDNTKGLGYFHLNTTYVNLSRLHPIVDTKVEKESTDNIDLEKFVADGYERILGKREFSKPFKVSDDKKKTTFGPSADAPYDYRSVSAGEDNLGHILSRMYAFVENQNSDDSLQGILCIDEIEASLHPIAQVNLIKYLDRWSKRYNVQVVITTHSLYLLQNILELQKKYAKNDIVLNIISTAYCKNNNYRIVENLSYNELYKELTLLDKDDWSKILEENRITVLCEDKVAETIIKKVIKKREIKKRIEVISDMFKKKEGTSCKELGALVKNGEKLLNDTIVVFDADINIEKYKKYNTFTMKTPSLYELPAEKEIVKFIYSLEGDHKFFRDNKKEKAAFIQEFSDFNILPSELEDINKLKDSKINKYKKWSNKIGKSVFDKYITVYIKENEVVMNEFRNEFIDIINVIFQKKSLPGIEC